VLTLALEGPLPTVPPETAVLTAVPPPEMSGNVTARQ
jgi:hypothetical protein